MTTTSTTGFVDVDTPSEYSLGVTEAWSTLHEAEYETCPNRPTDTRRRLRKPRPAPTDDTPASPEEVLARSEFNHTTCPSSFVPPASDVLGRGLRRLRSLPKISTTRKSFSPSPATTPTTETAAVPPMPPMPLPRSPSRSHSADKCPRSPALKKQRSMTKLVRESVEKLTRCHYGGRAGARRKDEWEHVHVCGV